MRASVKDAETASVAGSVTGTIGTVTKKSDLVQKSVEMSEMSATHLQDAMEEMLKGLCFYLFIYVFIYDRLFS
jgi:hypothetical protein